MPANVRGYTIVARPEAGTGADTAFLARITNEVGGEMSAVPKKQHRAEILAVVDPRGRLARADLDRPSDDRAMDEMLLKSVRAAFVDGIDAPPPAITGDSLVLRILFGAEPAPGEAYRRLSAQSRIPALRRRRLQMRRPAGAPGADVDGAVAIWVSFSGDSTSAPAEMNAHATDARLVPAARALARTLDFTPGQSDCKPMAYLLPVRFTFRGPGVRAEIVR